MRKKGKILAIFILVLVLTIFSTLFYQIKKAEAALTELRLTDLPIKVAKEAGLDLTVTAYE
ncbi:hypothetical protein KJ713_00290, partial [Patescibacteria group bacterium]|nr:hypothetical protein [Patescibacteria group bacterium]